MAFVYFFVFGRFSHVPDSFPQVFLHDVHKSYEIQLILKENFWDLAPFTRKRRFCKQAIVTFALWALEALFVV